MKQGFVLFPLFIYLYIFMKRIAYKYRIYPNTEQKMFFAKCFGCVRFFHNKSLSDMNEIYKSTGKFKNITPASYKEDYPFLKEVDSLALSNAQLNRNAAFKSFFSHKTGFPKFKSKRNDQSYTTNMVNGNIKISNNNKYISIPKCSRIRIKKHRNFIGTIKSITVSMTTDNNYYISLLVETEIEPLKTSKKLIGLDLGLKDLIVDSNGKKYKNHKYLTKSQAKLAKEQRKLSHMKKDSSHYQKQLLRVKNLHEHIANQRKDFLHKVSRKLANTYDYVFVENLDLKEMSERKTDLKLGITIFDLGYGVFLNYLKYKLEWLNKKLVKVDKFFPSSQLCSCCNYRKTDLTLNQRSWVCPICGFKHDRDLNAAINIKKEGIRMILNPSK